MSRGKPADPDQKREVERLFREGHSAAQGYRHMVSKGLLTFPHPPLTDRTIDRMFRKLKLADQTEPWTVASLEDEDGSQVLDVVLWAFRYTEGRVWLSTAGARWVARIQAISPGIPPDWAFILSQLYLVATSQKEDVRCLDLTLASKPWEDVRSSPSTWAFSIGTSLDAIKEHQRHRTEVNYPPDSWLLWEQDCDRLGLHEQWKDILFSWMQTEDGQGTHEQDELASEEL